MKPGPAPRFTRAVVGWEEEGSRDQSITFVALLRAAVWQMSSAVQGYFGHFIFIKDAFRWGKGMEEVFSLPEP